MHKLLFLVVSLLPLSLSAQDTQGVVALLCGQRTGTGCVVAMEKVNDIHYATILTCWHVICEDNGRDRVYVTFRNGQTFKGSVERWFTAGDTATVRVQCPADTKVIPIAQNPPTEGDLLRVRGLGKQNFKAGQIKVWECRAALPTSSVLVVSDTMVVAGDSGGPVTNEKGELVGIVAQGCVTTKNGDMFNPAEHWGMVAMGLKAIREVVND